MLYTSRKINIICINIIFTILLSNCQSSQKNEGENKDDANLIRSVKQSHLDSLEKQYYNISTDSTTFLITKKGACIVIHPQAFINEQGQAITGNIQIELREAQEIKDFVKSRISTTSDGKILQTAGSYYFDATQNGKKLKINTDNQGVCIAVPALQKDTAMRFFAGDPTKQGDINWKLDSKKEEKIDIPTPPQKTLDEFGLTLNEQKLKKQYEETVAFLKGIEKNYRLEGSKYVFKDSKSVYSESWEVSFIEKIRQKLKKIEWIKKYLADREEFNEKKKVKLKEAWNQYNLLNAEWKKQNKEILEPTFYEYKLNTMGWFNVDKFVREELVTYSGKIVNKQGKKINYARVHLISEKERIHLQTICETGVYQFEYPKNKTFKILVVRGKETKEVEIKASNTGISDIVF